MPPVVQGFGWGVDRVAALPILRMQRRVLGILDSLGSPFLGILAVPLWSDRGPLAQGHYSSVGGCLMSSIALVEDGLALFGRHIVCSHSRTGGLVSCWGMGSAGHGPSI